VSRASIFDEYAELYDAVRPGYPASLVDDVVALAPLAPGGRILEIGCATGQATRPFAARGYRIVAVELGERLAALARRNLAAHPNVEIRVGAFEEVELGPEAFDLVLSATAFHWIDPQVGYAKAARVLRPGGALALMWNEHVRGADDVGFFDATQDLYERAGMQRQRLLPDRFDDRSPAIVGSGHFGDVLVRRHPWQQAYDADTYARLLSTYSDHRRLAPDVRARLLDGIRALIDTRFSGRIVKSYVAILYLAHRVL
jgi:SAM-dependent methyltransferase